MANKPPKIDKAKYKVYDVVKLGYAIRAFPFYEKDLESTFLVFGSERQYVQWRILAAVHIFLRVLGVGGATLYEMGAQGVTMIETVQYYLYSSFLCLTIALQVCTFCFPKKVFAFHNTYQTFEGILEQVHDLDHKGSHAASVILHWIRLGLLSGVVVAFPVFALSIKFEVHVFELVNTGYIGVTLFLGGFMSYATLVDVIFIFYYVSAVLVYCSTVVNCLHLSKHKFNVDASKDRKRTLIICYFAHLILHYLMMQDLHILILICIALASGVLISSLFVVLQFWERVDTFVLLGAMIIFTVTFICMLVICKIASTLTELSVEFSQSWLRNEPNLSKGKVLQYRCCRPLRIPVGPFIYLNGMTFPFIVKNVVAETVIALIFGFG